MSSENKKPNIVFYSQNKAAWVRAAVKRNLKLIAWIIDACNRQAERDLDESN